MASNYAYLAVPKETDPTKEEEELFFYDKPDPEEYNILSIYLEKTGDDGAKKYYPIKELNIRNNSDNEYVDSYISYWFFTDDKEHFSKIRISKALAFKGRLILPPELVTITTFNAKNNNKKKVISNKINEAIIKCEEMCDEAVKKITTISDSNSSNNTNNDINHHCACCILRNLDKINTINSVTSQPPRVLPPKPTIIKSRRKPVSKFPNPKAAIYRNIVNSNYPDEDIDSLSQSDEEFNRVYKNEYF